MIVLDLAIWTLGAELLYPKGLTIREMDDLPRMLSQVLGEGGRLLFYLGVFAGLMAILQDAPWAPSSIRRGIGSLRRHTAIRSL
jgi:hypothetical protein